EFTFTIPLATTIPKPPAQGTLHLPASHRVLVVDDQRDVADMLASLLEMLGQDVRVAYDGPSAQIAAREQRSQVAFLDLSMPGISGPELARRLRREFPSSVLTLVAVSGHDKTHPDVQGGQFDYHLLKPVTAESIAELLDRLPV